MARASIWNSATGCSERSKDCMVLPNLKGRGWDFPLCNGLFSAMVDECGLNQSQAMERLFILLCRVDAERRQTNGTDQGLGGSLHPSQISNFRSQIPIERHHLLVAHPLAAKNIQCRSDCQIDPPL